jgi:hypothetical protein
MEGVEKALRPKGHSVHVLRGLSALEPPWISNGDSRCEPARALEKGAPVISVNGKPRRQNPLEEKAQAWRLIPQALLLRNLLR